jgi:hypothetical protein
MKYYLGENLLKDGAIWELLSRNENPATEDLRAGLEFEGMARGRGGRT